MDLNPILRPWKAAAYRSIVRKCIAVYTGAFHGADTPLMRSNVQVYQDPCQAPLRSAHHHPFTLKHPIHIQTVID